MKLAFLLQICDFVDRELGMQPTFEEEHVKNLMVKRRTLQAHRNMSLNIRGSVKEKQELLAVFERNKIIEKYRTSNQRKW